MPKILQNNNYAQVWKTNKSQNQKTGLKKTLRKKSNNCEEKYQRKKNINNNK